MQSATCEPNGSGNGPTSGLASHGTRRTQAVGGGALAGSFFMRGSANYGATVPATICFPCLSLVIPILFRRPGRCEFYFRRAAIQVKCSVFDAGSVRTPPAYHCHLVFHGHKNSLSVHWNHKTHVHLGMAKLKLVTFVGRHFPEAAVRSAFRFGCCALDRRSKLGQPFFQ